MIETLGLLVRLLSGLLSIQAVGYAILVMLLPSRAAFTSLERLALSLGLGCLGLCLWMLLLGWVQVPYSLLLLAGPWLLLILPALWLAGRRGWLQTDLQAVGRLLGIGATLGARAGFTRIEQVFVLLLSIALVWVSLRAMLYPFWAWDELATWGLKAKAFYLAQGIDMSRFEAHNYYPNLVPLVLTYLYFWLGGVVENIAKGFFPVCGGGLILLFYGSLRRLQVPRREALGAAAFVVLNGTTFLNHLFIAYADLMLTYYYLAAAGLFYLWLRGEAPARSAVIIAVFAGGMACSKYEGWPLVLVLLLAALLALIWLRPPDFGRKMGVVLLIGLAGFLLTLPWRQFVHLQGWDVGLDHVGGFYPEQLVLGSWFVLQAVVYIPYFGLLWPCILLSFLVAGRAVLHTPVVFLALLVAGNLAATVLAYAIVPTSAAEFPLYIRATVDRLLLHAAPASALIFAVPLAGGLAGSRPACIFN